MIEYTTLGNLIAPAKVIRCGKGSFPVLSMTMHDGIVLQSERFKKSLASIDQSDYKVVKRGQLVVGFPIDEGVLYVQKAADEGIMSPAYNVWDIDTEKVDPDFLELCLHSPQSMQYYKDKLRGTTARRRSIPTADLLALKIRLPDMQTQRETVAIMRKAEAVIAARQEQLNSFEQLVKSRFIELFGSTPDEEKVTMAEICRIITDGTHQPPKFVSSGIPFLFVSNIVTNEICYDSQKYISEETYAELIKRTPIAIGDVLLSTVGSYGHPAVVKTEKPFCFQRHIAYLKPNLDKVDSEYLRGAILSADVQRQIDEGVKGIAQKTLNLSEIRKIKLPLPPMELQQQFAAFVEQTDKSKYYSSLSYHLCRQAASYYRQEWMTCRTSNS